MPRPGASVPGPPRPLPPPVTQAARARGCVRREDTLRDQPGTEHRKEVKGFGHMWRVTGSVDWVVRCPGGSKSLRDPRKARASCSGWGQQWAARQAGSRPLKLRESPHRAQAERVQRLEGKLRPFPGAGGWTRARAIGVACPYPAPDAFNFLCSLGFFEALVRKLTPLERLRTLRTRRAA
ncbi:hypothetical protein NN561_013924 [Cricetulus griseus]